MSRIIAGSHGGRRLSTPAGAATRPTTDRVREALFSAIASWAATTERDVDQALRGLSFCDLYAGSGAVGLEAASRGAAPVLLVESHGRTAAVAAANARSLGLQVSVRTEKVETVVGSAAPTRFDVVFADPPYAVPTEAVEDVVAGLVTGGWLAADGLVVVERSQRSRPLRWPRGFSAGWSRHYGETVLQFGCLAEDEES